MMRRWLPLLTPIGLVLAIFLPLWGVLLIWTGRLWYHPTAADLFDLGFGPSQWLALAVMLVAAALLGTAYGVAYGPRSARRDGFPRRLFFELMVITVVAWSVFLIVLGVGNLTPLCVGRNNGDGSNTLSDCIVLTGILGIFYTVLMALPISGCVWGLSRLLIRFAAG